MRLFGLSWLFLLWLNPNESLQQNEIKCQLTLPPLRGTRYEPAYRSLFSPGEKIRVTCGEGYWILNTQTTSTETTCKNDGDWTIRPVCEEVTCSHPQTLYLDHWGDSGQQQRLGDTVSYRCGSDYRSTDGAAWATCTRDGWEPNPLCQAAYGCKRPPSISDGDIKTSAKYHYQHKEKVEYICHQYYTMEGGPFKTCINGEWTGEIRCHQNCRVPEVPAGLRITTDVTGNQIRKGQHLTFACEDSSHVIKGNATTECLENGQWSNPLPTCETAKDCRRPPPPLSHGDTKTWTRNTYRHNEKVEYVCNRDYSMEGGPFITCVDGDWVGEMRCRLFCDQLMDESQTMDFTSEKEKYMTGEIIEYQCKNRAGITGTATCQHGKWAKTIECEEKCRVPETPAGLTITTDVTDNQIRKGQYLTFACKNSNHIIKGNATLECLENERWTNPLPTCEAAKHCWTPPRLSHGNTKTWTSNTYSHNEKVEYVCDRDYSMEGGPFKTCVDGDWVGEMRCRPAQGCRRPPPLSDGDTKSRPKYQYQHNDKVEFICQPYYVMEGGPFKTCKDGEWTGEIRCLRPCTVNREDMNRHNIQFRYSRDDRLYSEHNDIIEFRCTRGRPVGTLGLRQKCEDGVIHLPTCQ